MSLFRRINRRTLIARFAAAGVGLAAGDLALPFVVQSSAPPPHVPVPATPPLQIGATFSPLEAEYLEQDPKVMLDAILGLKLDYLRVGAYWNRIETRDGEFDFADLDATVEAAEQASIPLILTIGIKAPVWPEYHLPWWVWESESLPPTGLLTRSARLRELGGRFVRTVAERYAQAGSISILQVENEPFEPVLSDRGWTLDDPFLRQQVGIVREADRLNRPILLTAYVACSRWVSGLQAMQHRWSAAPVLGPVLGNRPDATLLELGDIIGLDIYPAIGWNLLGQPVYLRAETDADYAPLLAYRDAILAAGKQVMIAECQAKPWEPGEKIYRSLVTPSFSPADTPPLVNKLAGWGFPSIALWGVEHWYWHREYGDPAWWEIGARLLADR